MSNGKQGRVSATATAILAPYGVTATTEDIGRALTIALWLEDAVTEALRPKETRPERPRFELVDEDDVNPIASVGVAEEMECA